MTPIELEADNIQHARPDRLGLTSSRFELYWSVLKRWMLLDNDTYTSSSSTILLVRSEKRTRRCAMPMFTSQ
jgi:hypothetical protein